MSSNPLKIDGSYLEGGGQILRSTVCLSCLLKRDIYVHKIRKNRRPKTGLRNQHLIGIRFIRSLCNGELKNDRVESENILFTSSYSKLFLGQKKYTVDAITAGAICLLIQISLPVLLLAPRKHDVIKVIYKGGTNVDFAPNYEYFSEVFCPIFIKGFLGKKKDILECRLINRCSGNVRLGNGEMELKIKQVEYFSAINMTEKGKLKKIKIISICCGKVQQETAEELAVRAEKKLLRKYKGVQIEKVVKKEMYKISFCQLMLVAETTTKKSRKKAVNKVVDRVIDKLNKNIECGCVDEYMQDQLLIFMALSKGRSVLRTSSLSKHSLTGIHFLQLMCGVNFEIIKQDDESCLVEVDGIGLSLS